jgi:hypothetical protein
VSVVVPDEWVDGDELARWLSVSRRKVERMADEGMPSEKLATGHGGARRYYKPAVYAWLVERGEEVPE